MYIYIQMYVRTYIYMTVHIQTEQSTQNCGWLS